MSCFGLVAIAVFIVLQFATAAVAVQPDEMLAEPKLEARARALSRELRCMVCQNQSIDDSEAPLARDLRILVRERLQAGDSDAQVLAASSCCSSRRLPGTPRCYGSRRRGC